jgi:hypothetical protein
MGMALGRLQRRGRGTPRLGQVAVLGTAHRPVRRDGPRTPGCAAGVGAAGRLPCRGHRAARGGAAGLDRARDRAVLPLCRRRCCPGDAHDRPGGPAADR